MQDTKPVTRSKQHGFRARLAIGTALATIAFGYGGRGAYAGACVGPAPSFTCSGAAGADTTQAFAAPGITLTTTAGFGMSTASGNAISVYGNGGASFSDNNSSVITGAAKGVRGSTYGAGGPLSITSTGTVTGVADDGIWVRNYAAGGDTSVNANVVNGGLSGISAVNFGAGVLTVSATGTVTGTSAYGILAGSGALGDGLSVTAAAVNGGASGIRATNYGFGATSVTATGQVTGSVDGIFVLNGAAGGNMTVDAAAATGGVFGINARSYGTGALSITSTGQISGNGLDGVFAVNTANGTDLSVTVNDVAAARDGVFARNYGSGTNTVTVNGIVSGGTGAGIHTVTGVGGSTVVSLNSGADISSASGMAIVNDAGNSAISVYAGAAVTGAVSLGGGADSLTFDGGSFATVTNLNGGTGQDTLTFRNVSGTVAGNSITGWENIVVASGAGISVSGALDTTTLTVDVGGTLGGTGTVYGDITVNGGTLGPGNSPGLLSVVGDLDLGVTSKLLIELGGTTAGTQYDRVDVADDPATGSTVEGIATLAAGSVIDIDFFSGFLASLGDTFDVLVADEIVADINSLIFDFSGAALSAGLEWHASLFALGDREALRLTVASSLNSSESDDPIALPVPSSIVLFATSLLGLVGLRRRQRKTV